MLYDNEGRPQKVDPDDFIRQNGPEAFARLLDKPQTDGQYRMGEIRAKYVDLTDDQTRIAYLKEAAEYISTLQSPVEREIFAGTAAQESGLPAEAVRKEVERIRSGRRRRQQKEAQREALQPEKQLQPKDWKLRYGDARSAVVEERLIAAVLGDKQLAEYAQVRLDPEQFSSGFLARVYQTVLDRLDRDLDPDPAACMNGLEPAEVQLLTHILSKYAGLRDQTEQVKQYIETIQYQYQKRTASADDPEVLLEAIRRKQG